MSFRDPFQNQHKIDGMKKAAMSPRTPAHLRPHIHKRIKEHEAMHNKATMAGTHGRGAKTSPVKLPQRKSQPQTPGQSPKTGAGYEMMHPARAAELQTANKPSAEAERQIAAPPYPFKTKNSTGAAVASTPAANLTGPDQKPTAGLSGLDDGGPIESQAGPVAAGPKAVPRANAKNGAMNQASVSKPFGDHNQPHGRKTPKKSLFFGE